MLSFPMFSFHGSVLLGHFEAKMEKNEISGTGPAAPPQSVQTVARCSSLTDLFALILEISVRRCAISLSTLHEAAVSSHLRATMEENETSPATEEASEPPCRDESAPVDFSHVSDHGADHTKMHANTSTSELSCRLAYAK